MKKALIDPNAPVTNITSWVYDDKLKRYVPVMTEIPNSDRVAEVVAQEFEIAPPLFWVDCADDVVADLWYYDNVAKQTLLVPPPAPYPETTVEGAQNL